jgi:hypothetical protein
MRLIALLLFPVAVFSQEIRPPVITYPGNHASDSFELRNMSDTTPMQVVALTPKTFTVDSNGNPTFADIDPTKISLRLSEQGARIAPSQTHQFWADIKCLQNQPCWVCIFASIAAGRAPNGVLVTVMLPHTIEMMAGSVKKKEVQIKFTGSRSFEIENQGSGFDRPQLEITAGGKKLLSGVAIFPGQTRVITTDAPIEKIRIAFTKFTLHEKP